MPSVVAACLLLLAGNVIARFLSRSVLIGAVNMNLQYARLLAGGVKWMVIVLAVAMALDQLAIRGDIVHLAFGILFGGIVLALALAVGLGSKELVSPSLEREALGVLPILGNHSIICRLANTIRINMLRHDMCKGLFCLAISAVAARGSKYSMPILDYIHQTWTVLTRSNRTLASSAADPKFHALPDGRWPVYIAENEDISLSRSSCALRCRPPTRQT